MLQLIKKFQPLIAKYARKLGYEDAFEDIQVKFIEIIKYMKLEQFRTKTNPYLLKYLKTSIVNHCIKLSQKQRANKAVPFSSLMDNTGEDNSTYFVDKLFFVPDEYPQIENDALSSILTPYECKVIFYCYFQRYTVKEIAQYYHVSAPAISQVKTNALKKLRKHMEKEMKFCG